MNLLFIMYIIVTTYIIIDTRHHLCRFDIRFCFFCILYLLNPCQGLEKVKIFPQQINGIAVYIILFGVVGQHICTITDNVQARFLFSNILVCCQSMECIRQITRFNRAVSHFFLDALSQSIAFTVNEPFECLHLHNCRKCVATHSQAYHGAVAPASCLRDCSACI